jgi:ABC-type Fe3+/spermidine/putrescine transport system ATPase subunit
MPSSDEGLIAKGVARRIGDFTLEADFAVGPAERMVIQAPSGTGKTSLLRILAGLERPDRGQVWLGGRDVTELAPPRRDIGVVFQDAALFGSMSVWENAAFGLRMRGMGKARRREEALKWLERVGLARQAEAGVATLSGGERQRVGFVRALIWKPRLLLLDEPFSALDAGLRQGLRRELLGLLQGEPVPMILVTHDREDAEALATATATIVQAGPGIRRLETVTR